MFINTTRGSVTLNTNILPEVVINSLHKYNLNKGACISVTSSRVLLAEDGNGAGIQFISNCKATTTQSATAKPVSSTSPIAAKPASRFQIDQTTGKVALGSCYMDSCS